MHREINHIITIILLLCWSVSAFANTRMHNAPIDSLSQSGFTNINDTTLSLNDSVSTPQPVTEKSEPRKKWLLRIADKYDESMLRKVDTNYIILPNHRCRIAVNSEFSGINSTIRCKDVPYYQNVKGRFHFDIMPKTGIILSYRNANISHNTNISCSAQDCSKRTL